MEKNELIGEKEMTLLLVNLLSIKTIFAFPRTLFEAAGNAAWIELIFIALFAWIMLELSFLTYKISGRKSIIELSWQVGGNALKSAVSLLVIAVMAISVITETRMFAESVKLVLLPKTDMEYIMILLAVAVFIGQKRSLSAIATVNAVFFPICLLFLIFIVVFTFNRYDINNMFPILAGGTKSIFSGGMKNISCFGDLIVLNLLLPRAKDISIPKRCGRKALLIASMTMLFICLSYALCYPYPLSKEYLLPVYQLSKMIRAGEYFQRFEAFFEFVWEISQLLYVSIYLFLICETAAKGFDLSDRKAVSYVVIVIVTIIISEKISIIKVLEITRLLNLVAAPFAYLLPLIIPLLYLKKKEGKG